jgi:isocitrate/isopropylmalate dehydrogenase
MAIEQTLADGIKTQDIGGTATTVEITDAILDRLVA